jgi:hypothetical protein
VGWLDPWVRARAAWAVVLFTVLLISGLAWVVGGYAFCGTDTSEPDAFGDWACESLVRPVVPWLLIVAIPFTIALVGGHLGLKRQSWALFALSVVGAPLLLVVGLFSLTAFF